MTLNNVDIGGWKVDENGAYMGIGFGSPNIQDSDAVICCIPYSGDASTDSFICTEMILDYGQIRNWWDPDFLIDYFDIKVEYSGNLANYKVSVSRLLDVTQTDESYTLQLGLVHDITWAYGGHYPADQMPLWYHGLFNRGNGKISLDLDEKPNFGLGQVKLEVIIILLAAIMEYML